MDQCLLFLLLISVVLNTGRTLSILTIQSDKSEVDDDSWGSWGEWQQCSRSCGGGITYMQRKCLNDGSSDGGKCTGEDKMYSSCSIQDCPVYSQDFRYTQCSEFDKIKEYKGRKRHWLPYYGHDPKYSSCSLHCQPQDAPFDIVQLKDKVVDGTRCRRDSFDSCVDGQCQEMGCDMILGSDMRLDVCGECGGDDTSCSIFQGSISSGILSKGINGLFSVPPGTANIKLSETKGSNNYFQIRDSSGQIIIGRNQSEQHFNLIHASGVDIFYDKIYKRRQRKPMNSIFIRGPTAETFDFEIVIRDKVRGISYQLYLPNGEEIESKNEWKVKNIGNCTKLCGGGKQRRKVRCIADKDTCAVLHKPPAWADCNTHQCEVRWQADEWQPCSRSCDVGRQIRSVNCIQVSPFQGSSATLLSQEKCNGIKPTQERECNTHECDEWRTSAWSECSTTCGTGFKARRVVCSGDACDHSERPNETISCNTGPCSEVDWVVTQWTECTEGCGQGMTTRIVECADSEGLIYVNSTYCDSNMKPDEIIECYSTRKCPDPPKWMTGQWSPCSVNCGSGIQTRRVVCSVFSEGAIRTFPDHQCLEASDHPKPSFLQNCVKPKCHSLWFAGVWSSCSVSCGGGSRTRRVFCGNVQGKHSSEVNCVEDEKPVDSEKCNDEECEDEESCLISRYGCCSDGTTFANGPNFAGCVQTTTQPPVSAEDCHLPADQGTCTQWQVRWQYLSDDGACIRFWYGGCGGNANSFSTEQQCLETCKQQHHQKQPTSDEQSTRDVDASEIVEDIPTTESFQPSNRQTPTTHPRRCLLRLDVGSCNGHYERWYYNSTQQECLIMFYGGCGGNENIFGSRESCQSICRHEVRHEEPEEAFLAIDDGEEKILAGQGDTVSLECPARGNPEPAVMWFYENGTEVNNGRAQVLADYSLLIDDVDVNDSGSYACRAHNSLGQSQVRRVQLEVKEVSIFVEKPEDTSVQKGETVVIKCRISSEVIFLTWHKGGAQIVDDNKHRIQPWGDLRIFDASKEDVGRYTCSAYSVNEVKTASANLDVTNLEPISSSDSSSRYAAAYRPSTSLRVLRLYSNSRRTSPHCRDQPLLVNCEVVVERGMCTRYHAFCCESCRRRDSRHHLDSKR